VLNIKKFSMKRKQTRKSRNKRSRRSLDSRLDPSYQHVLTYDAASTIIAPTSTSVVFVPWSSISGLSQLAAFFEMAHPLRYRLRLSYTNWSGTLAFVPINPYAYGTLPSLTNLDNQALREVRGSIRVQSGFNNTGSWCTFPFANQGWNAYGLFNAGPPLGYYAAFNDAPGVTANWTIQLTLEVVVIFRRRTLYSYTVTPTKKELDEEPPDTSTEEVKTS
jgi:hypothetical protein